MRIVHAYKVFKPEIEGGIPEVIDTLASGLTRMGHDNRIVVARRRGLGTSDTYHGVPLTRTASLGDLLSLPLSPTYPLALWRAARGADILALHTPFPLADPVAALLPRNIGLVVHWHSDIVRQKKLGALLSPMMHAMLRRADRIVISHESIGENTPTLRPYLGKAVVIPYGIALGGWREEEAGDQGPIADLQARHPILFVAIGRLVTYKGFDVLIEAMTRVQGHLVICGEGDERPRLEALIRQHGLTSRVTLAGKMEVADIRRHLKAATALVLSSISPAETFGIVQVEAMATGVAVINTQLATAVPFVARDGHEALTVPVGDPEALAAAMDRLTRDQALRAALATAGQRRAEAIYSADAFVKGVCDAYDDIRGAAATHP